MFTKFGLSPLVVLPILGAMLALRWLRVGMLTWVLAWWAALWAGIVFGFVTPVPASVVKLYMSIVTLALFAYVTSSEERRTAFAAPIVALVTRRERRLALLALMAAVPLVAAFNVYRTHSVPVEAPAFGRTVHPAPPDTITVHDSEVNLVTAQNPYRELERSDPEAFKGHLANGRRVYFQNCFFCHGDAMAGDGMFAHGLNPIPSNFTDRGVLPMLQESFLFWRISKGGPGLPDEGGPWDSAMPAWERFLTEEEIWDTILFLYDYNGYRPRAREEHAK